MHWHVTKPILGVLLGQPADLLQSTCATAGCFVAFIATYLSVFFPRLALFRSALILFSAICALLASRAIPVPFTLHPRDGFPYAVLGFDQAAVDTMTPIVPEDHAPFFLVMSATMAASAYIGILPIQRAIPRLLFLIWFGYSFAHAV